MTGRTRAAAVLVIAAAAMLSGCVGVADTEPIDFEVTVLAEGLTNPVGLAMLPTGGLLVAEEGTGENDDSAGISLVDDGRVIPVVTGLPSGRDSGDLSGVAMVGVSPDGSQIYTSHFGAGALLTFPAPSPTALEAGVVLRPSDLRSTMEPLNRVSLTNAFDIAFDPDGVPVVTDASGNGVATLADGDRTEFIHRFGELRDPAQESVRIDPVPTGIARSGDEYLVTLTGGCPYPDGAGRLVAIDGDRNERVVAADLTMPIDVTVGPDGTVWVLEFARFDPDGSCFSGDGYQPRTGRLSQLDGERLTTVVDELDFPGAVVAGPDGSLYVSEVFGGRILHLTPEATAEQAIPRTTGDQPARPWRLHDVTAEVGIDFHHGAFSAGLSEDPVAMMGGGLCWLDADGDDDLDLYLVNSHASAEANLWAERGGLPTNRLYRNEDGRFRLLADSGAELAVRGNGCLAADLDGDDDIDIYVTADGPNALLVNDGTGRFIERGAARGVAVDGWSSAAAAADVDGDGNVDLFVGTYIDFDRKVDNPVGAFPQDYRGEPNLLFLGRGDGTFEDGTATAGLSGDLRTLGALFSDLDLDGDLDLYLTNDGQPNTLYENRSGGGRARLVEVTGPAAPGDTGSGMGVAGGDYDGDGATDLMVTNWEVELHAVYRGLPPVDGTGLEPSASPTAPISWGSPGSVEGRPAGEPPGPTSTTTPISTCSSPTGPCRSPTWRPTPSRCSCSAT